MKNKKKNYKDENRILWLVIKDIIWMAIRYAHGRNTYAPSMIRDAVIALKKINSKFKLKDDTHTIKAPTHKLIGMDFRSDYLDDLFEREEKCK